MKLKKSLAAVAIAAALLIGATAPASAISICDVPTTSFDIWFAKMMARCNA